MRAPGRTSLYPLLALALAAAAVAAPASPPSSDPKPKPVIEERPKPSIVALDVIRIGILHDVPEAKVKSVSPLILFDMTTGIRRVFATGVTLTFSVPEAGRLEASVPSQAAPISLSGSVRLAPERTNGRVLVNGKPYRGSILLKAGAEGITAVDELGLEEYLYGVLPLEMSPEWPAEALKAQAVIARSYAVFNLGRFGPDGFDLSSDERSQVYDGAGPEDPKTTKAVEDTEGQVLAYHGTILNAFFHACCGGHTAPVSTIWGDSEPERPFQGVRDSWCSASPHYNWKVHVSKADALAAFQRGGLMATRLLGLAIDQRDRSGYVYSLRVTTEQGREIVRANQFRKWLGNGHLKSINWTRLIASRSGFDIIGHGYGHGVGLCQWGTRAQAQKGREYKRILQFYYPGTNLRRLED